MKAVSPADALNSKWIFQLFSTSLTGMDIASSATSGSIHAAFISPEGFGFGFSVGVGVDVEPPHAAMLNVIASNNALITIPLNILCILLLV